MPMVPLFAPYRMHTNIQDLSLDRMAARFGLGGLADPEDPRETGKVLPMTRGSSGYFYTEGSGERRQLSQDAHWRGHWGIDRTGLYRPGLKGLGLPIMNTDGGGVSPYYYYPRMTAPILNLLPLPAGPLNPVVTPVAPNQSVPPTDTSTPLPTGSGSAGGNVLMTSTAPPATTTTTTDNTWLYVALGAAALLLFSGKGD